VGLGLLNFEHLDQNVIVHVPAKNVTLKIDVELDVQVGRAHLRHVGIRSRVAHGVLESEYRTINAEIKNWPFLAGLENV
jgi:hypothetical protein